MITGLCPTCSGSGYNGRGDYCATCGGTGRYVPLIVPALRDPWLYLPHDCRWINPSHIVTIMARTTGDDAPPIGYGIVIGLSPAETWVDVIHPLDVAAVTAWLEARS